MIKETKTDEEIVDDVEEMTAGSADLLGRPLTEDETAALSGLGEQAADIVEKDSAIESPQKATRCAVKAIMSNDIACEHTPEGKVRLMFLSKGFAHDLEPEVAMGLGRRLRTQARHCSKRKVNGSRKEEH